MLLCISLLTSGLAAFTFGKAAFSRSPKAPPPNTSGQSAKGPLNLRTAVCGSVQSIDEIPEPPGVAAYPTVVYVPLVLRIAFRVKSKSAHVIGVPSDHFAAVLIL